MGRYVTYDTFNNRGYDISVLNDATHIHTREVTKAQRAEMTRFCRSSCAGLIVYRELKENEAVNPYEFLECAGIKVTNLNIDANLLRLISSFEFTKREFIYYFTEPGDVLMFKLAFQEHIV